MRQVGRTAKFFTLNVFPHGADAVTFSATPVQGKTKPLLQFKPILANL